MKKKPLFIGIISLVILSIVFGYSLVFAGSSSNIKLLFIPSQNIYLDSLSLKTTQVLFESNKDLSDFTIKSECSTFSKMTNKNRNLYVFKLKFFDNKCENENFTLVDEKGEIKVNFKLNLISEYLILSKLLDLNTKTLEKIDKNLDENINKNIVYQKYNKNIESNYYKFLQKNRLLEELIYKKNIVKNILEKRSEKYIVPVIGGKIDLKASKIPNAGRPYRASYTDGIHHGWDVAGELEKQVVALDDGIIVRVVSEFDFSDLDKIKKGKNLTEYDKIKNLDILRGKQVWLKTMSGDVVMYSHLTDVFTNIQVGEVVRKKQPLGTLGITGVPDKKYNDYHLHFPVHMNSFDSKKAGKYDIDDYMSWDWLFKGKSKKYILENVGEYFEK